MSNNLQDVTIGNPQETDVAWLAGLVDGEGTFVVSKNRYAKDKPPSVKAQMSIPNTNERIIEKAVRVIRSMGIKPYVTEHPPRAGNRKRHWRVAVTKLSDMAKITDLLLPYLARSDNAILMNRYAHLRMTGPWIDGGLDPHTGKHRMRRRPLAVEEWDLVRGMYDNNNGTGSSTTTREAARRNIVPDNVYVR